MRLFRSSLGDHGTAREKRRSLAMNHTAAADARFAPCACSHSRNRWLQGRLGIEWRSPNDTSAPAERHGFGKPEQAATNLNRFRVGEKFDSLLAQLPLLVPHLPPTIISLLNPSFPLGMFRWSAGN